MDFFKLTSPNYETDQEARRRNPVSLNVDYFIPSIRCPDCGTWSSSDRLRGPFQQDQLDGFRGITFLDSDRWRRQAPAWALTLGLPVEAITPGAELGTPVAKVTAEELEDFVHPAPGQILAQHKVVSILQAANVTGVSFVPLYLASKKPMEELWELAVSGYAWRKGVDERTLTACSICGRKAFPKAPFLIDEDRSSKTDFFILDQNPNMVFVTRRVCEILRAADLWNYQCKPA